jgi:hypothetical protein
MWISSCSGLHHCCRTIRQPRPARLRRFCARIPALVGAHVVSLRLRDVELDVPSLLISAALISDTVVSEAFPSVRCARAVPHKRLHTPLPRAYDSVEVRPMVSKFLILGGLVLCVVGCASSSPTRGPATDKTANRPPAGCVLHTGSRIPASPGECTALGNTWSKTDIDQTGATVAGQALRLLDPTVTVTQ